MEILKSGRRYTFRDYFHFPHPCEEILAELGYTLSVKRLMLPRATFVSSSLVAEMQSDYEALALRIFLGSETAKREVMVAPLLHRVIRLVPAKLYIEYPLSMNDRLNGVLDYFCQGKHALVVIAAKKDDLERGFSQRAAEMIALHLKQAKNLSVNLYGAVTIGDLWRFATLSPRSCCIEKDIQTFRFPEDLADLFSVLLGILQPDPAV